MKRTLNYKHMQFLYTLTRTTQYLNHEGLSKALRFDNEKVTPQTIHNWFMHLKKYDFNYFHSIIFEKLGLTPLFVISKNDLPESAFTDNVWAICNPYSLEKLRMTQYLVPSTQVKEFTSTVLQNSEEYYALHSCYVLSPPYHKIMKYNRYYFNKLAKEDMEDPIKLFRYYLSKMDQIKEKNILKREPLLLPIIIESRRNNISSIQIWNAIKNRLGDGIRNYLLRKKETEDEIGIKKVQKKIKLLNNELNYLVQQIDIDYPPLLSHTLPFALFVEYHEKEELIELVRKVVMKSARVVIYPHSTKALMICYMQIDGMKEIMSINPGEAKITKTFLIYNMLERSTFDYAKCFDAVKKEWLPIHQVCT